MERIYAAKLSDGQEVIYWGKSQESVTERIAAEFPNRTIIEWIDPTFLYRKVKSGEIQLRF